MLLIILYLCSALICHQFIPIYLQQNISLVVVGLKPAFWFLAQHFNHKAISGHCTLITKISDTFITYKS